MRIMPPTLSQSWAGELSFYPPMLISHQPGLPQELSSPVLLAVCKSRESQGQASSEQTQGPTLEAKLLGSREREAESQ